MGKTPPQGGTGGFYKSEVITSESDITYAGEARILYCETDINITLSESLESPGRIIDVEAVGGNPALQSDTTAFRLVDGSTQPAFGISNGSRDRTVFFGGAWLVNSTPA